MDISRYFCQLLCRDPLCYILILWAYDRGVRNSLRHFYIDITSLFYYHAGLSMNKEQLSKIRHAKEKRKQVRIEQVPFPNDLLTAVRSYPRNEGETVNELLISASTQALEYFGSLHPEVRNTEVRSLIEDHARRWNEGHWESYSELSTPYHQITIQFSPELHEEVRLFAQGHSVRVDSLLEGIFHTAFVKTNSFSE
jgi:hypothetical protein